MFLQASRGRLHAAASFGLVAFAVGRGRVRPVEWRCSRTRFCGRRGASGRHDRDGDAARARRAHTHDCDDRLRLCMAGRHHCVRGWRLPCRRRVRRRWRSREERAAARRVVDSASPSGSRDQASDAEAARSRARERAGGARARPVPGNDEPAVESGSRSADSRSKWRRSRGSSPRAPTSIRRTCGSSSRT